MADSKAHQRWLAENTTRVVMNLNHNTDADIIQHLGTVPSKQGYIKSLIRADMDRAARKTRGMTKRQARLLEDMQALLEK